VSIIYGLLKGVIVEPFYDTAEVYKAVSEMEKPECGCNSI
jgi:hypothetical protein